MGLGSRVRFLFDWGGGNSAGLINVNSGESRG